MNSRILYIEDHEDTRELLTFVLQKRGYEVVTAHTMEGALASARAQTFDLYLLDSWLPDGSGIELCTRIREFDQKTPILFYSAAAYAADKQSALNSGAQAYIIKPANFSKLCNVISNLIRDSAEGEKGDRT